MSGGRHSSSVSAAPRMWPNGRPGTANARGSKIGQADGDGAVKCAFAGETGEGGRRCPIPKRACHFERIAQAEVEALARHRVDRLGGIADGGDATVDRNALGVQPERERMARAGVREAAHALAKGSAQFGEEGVVGQRCASECFVGRAAPDERIAGTLRVILRQQCERAFGRETLPCPAFERGAAAHVRDDGGLTVIAPARLGDAALLLACVVEQPAFSLDDDFGFDGQRMAPFAQRPHACRGDRTVGARQLFDALHGRVVIAGEAPRVTLHLRVEGGVERGAQVAVLHDVSERGDVVVFTADMRLPEVAALRDVDVRDGRGARGPAANLLQQHARAMRQRQRARVSRGGFGVARIEQGDAPVGVAQQPVGQRQPDGPGANDGHVEVRCGAARCDAVGHAWLRITSSISSGATGTSRVMISQPSGVTMASSSMRMPMCQYCSGTPGAGRT